MTTLVIMPGGFHPFHAGHMALYNAAKKAFPGAQLYVAATNATTERPFPFNIKEKLAKVAGVEPGHFIQVKSPFRSEEITQHFNPNKDTLIFVRSEKDKNESPKPGGIKKDGTPAYFQPLAGNEDKLQPFSKHAYFAYLPTVEFGPGITSATQIRTAWPTLNDKRKLAMVMSLYPATQNNPKLAQNVVKLLDAGMGGQLDEISLFRVKGPQVKEPKHQAPKGEPLGYKHLFKPEQPTPPTEKRFHGWDEYEREANPEQKPDAVEENRIFSPQSKVLVFYKPRMGGGERQLTARPVSLELANRIIDSWVHNVNSSGKFRQVDIEDFAIIPANASQYSRSSSQLDEFAPSDGSGEDPRFNPETFYDIPKLKSVQRRLANQSVNWGWYDLKLNQLIGAMEEIYIITDDDLYDMFPTAPEIVYYIIRNIIKAYPSNEPPYIIKNPNYKPRAPRKPKEGPLNEFAIGNGDDGEEGPDNHEAMRRLAAAWYNGDEDPRVEKTLRLAGWDIGQDEGYEGEPGVYVIQRGDETGDSYMSWSADELRGLEETKVSKYKDLGATKDTTHFIKNVTTGEIVSPHRSKQDAEDALVAHYRGPRDGNEYKIVRARKDRQLDEFAPGNGDDDDGDYDLEYQVYQCSLDNQFDWIGGPLHQDNDLGRAHDFAYKLWMKHPDKSFMIYQPSNEYSRGGYGPEGSDVLGDSEESNEDYLDE